MVLVLQIWGKNMNDVERYAANLAAIQEREQQIAALKRENESLRPVVEAELLSSDTLRILTRSGVLSIEDEISVSSIDEILAVAVAKQHGVKISTRTPEYVHTQTLKSAIVKKQIPFGIARTIAVVETKSKITLK